MQSSILDRIFPPSSPLLPQHDHRSSRSPSSTTSSPVRFTLAAPVSSSTILRPAPVSTSLTRNNDSLLPIDRAAKSLQRTIQSLLDAQSEGLLAGLTSNDGHDELSSNGSLTPTPTMSSTSTSRRPTTIPVRQPPQKKISLRGARRGLSRSMQDFAALKEEEERILEAQVEQRVHALNTVEAFAAKRDGIQSEIASISSESGAQSAGHLRAEADQLDMEIRGLEDKLFEMKARHRYLVDEAQQLESSVQSKLSSYKASLDLLDKDIKRFLARPPVGQSSTVSTQESVHGMPDTGSFYALNPKRRTLQMASEHWHEEREDLKHRKEAVASEKRALEDGGRIWREVVTEVQTFEKDLKAQMQKLSVESMSQQGRDEGMATLLSRMDKTLKFLEQRLQDAEEKNWKLLVCCIGAELEAFREGREILVEASGLKDDRPSPEGEQKNGSSDDDHDDGAATPDFLTTTDPIQLGLISDDEATAADHGYGTGSTILTDPKSKSKSVEDRLGTETTSPTTTVHELLPSLARPDRSLDSRSSSSEHSENDDPGPDFLISHT